MLETENTVGAGSSGLGRFVQPAWLETPSYTNTVVMDDVLSTSSHSRAESLCKEPSWEIKQSERRYRVWTEKPLMKPSETFLLSSALSFKEWHFVHAHLFHEQYVWGLGKFLMGCRTCHLCARTSDVVQILVGSMLITSDNTLMAFMLFSTCSRWRCIHIIKTLPYNEC